jgi:seryl-tRNA synthetase
MSLDKATADRLSQRIEELIVILKRILEDLQEVSQSLKQIYPSMPTSPAPSPTVAERELSIENIRALFPKELEEMLAFEEKEKYIVVRPRQFLGSENFAKIASIVRGAGGEYISAGKESHFRISKETK